MTLTFAVHRREPVLVGPASPTPHEVKRLSDIDDQETLRGHVPFVLIYRGGGDHARLDHADAIRRSLAEALVHYYPLAGRLREVDDRKLVVDCSGEGVLFVEADADVRLAELETAGLRPPFRCMEQLLFDVEGSSAVLNSPLLLIQVTRLLCGGFVFAVRFNHTICDSMGILQFMAAVAELSRGRPSPTVAAAWSRELLDACTTPKPSFPHREYDLVPLARPPLDDLFMRSFSFGSADIAGLRQNLPPHLRGTATTFEILAAFIWKVRATAVSLPPGEDERLVIIVNVRGVAALRLPAGYYGNACVPSTAVMASDALRGAALGDVVELVQTAKSAVTAEYVRSMADLMVLRGRPHLAMANMFVVSDVRHAGFHLVDLGWGGPVYGGPVDTLSAVSFFVAAKNGDGEDEVVVPIILPRPAMERFTSEIERLLKG